MLLLYPSRRGEPAKREFLYLPAALAFAQELREGWGEASPQKLSRAFRELFQPLQLGAEEAL